MYIRKDFENECVMYFGLKNIKFMLTFKKHGYHFEGTKPRFELSHAMTRYIFQLTECGYTLRVTLRTNIIFWNNPVLITFKNMF